LTGRFIIIFVVVILHPYVSVGSSDFEQVFIWVLQVALFLLSF